MTCGLGPARLGVVAGDAEVLLGAATRRRPSSPGVFHVKRILHCDLIRVLTTLRKEVPAAKTDGVTRQQQLLTYGYDRDELLARICDISYDDLEGDGDAVPF